jgi:hypothetical protein
MGTERINDVRAFRSFLDEKLSRCGNALTLDEALELWEFENLTDAERQDTLQAIRQGLADVDAGRTRPAEDVVRDLCRKHGLVDPTQ